MDPEKIDVLRQGDESGNYMIIRIALPSGREIYGFATENISSEEWHLGRRGKRHGAEAGGDVGICRVQGAGC